MPRQSSPQARNRSMSSLMSSHGMALAATATAMAVSGTVILVAMCRQQQQQRPVQQCDLRPCIASAARKGEDIRRTAKKRVRFGENMIVEYEDDCGDDDVEEEEEEEIVEIARNAGRGRGGCKAREMPANRAALYSGMMQDRLQRMACY